MNRINRIARLVPVSGRSGRTENAMIANEPATWFVADWRHMLFVHYRVPAVILQPHVPHPLDLHDGSAWISLVFFMLENMRPPCTGAIGRALCRPISEHPFLNVRTYVRAEAGPGIHFLAEWIPNRLSAWLGPRTYGLPYRLGSFDCDLAGGTGGVGCVSVTDPALGARLGLSFPVQPEPLVTAMPGTTDEFLLERYAAYTYRNGVHRCFRVAHASWRFHRATWLRADPTLLGAAFPWFAAAELHCAHLTPGVRDVRMSRPRKLSSNYALPNNEPFPRDALTDLAPTNPPAAGPIRSCGGALV